MPFAVELYFDEETEQGVVDLWQDVATAGISSFLPEIGARPHVSLAVLEAVDAERLSHAIEAFAPEITSPSLVFSAVGVFPGTNVVYLAPAVDAHLLEIHRRFHEGLASIGEVSHPYYRPGSWTPHCTVGMDLDGPAIQAAVGVCLRSDVFRPFTLSALGMIEFLPVRHVCCVPIGRR